MDVGFILATQYAQDRDISNVAQELIDQTTVARMGNFDSIFVSEHHVTEDQYLMNEAVLAHIAKHIGDMRLGTGVCLLPYHNPVRIAEYGATMDVLTGGQFCLGVGQGYRQAEFDAFGISRQDAVGRLVEGVEIIKRLWTEESVTYHGDHFDLDDVSINPKPITTPRPKIFAGASNESSIRRSAHIADGWIGAHIPFDTAQAQVEDFRDECRQVEDSRTVGLAREVFVAKTTEKAEAAVRDSLMEKYESYIEWGQDDVIESDNFDSPWEKLKHDRFLIGSPDDVREGIKRYQDALGLDELLVRMQFPSTKFKDVRQSIELFGEEVMPHL